MENQNQPKANSQIVPPSSYTLHRNQDPQDKSLYLYKDGVAARCPFASSVHSERLENGDLQSQIIICPCGTFCHLFNLIPNRKKDTKELTGKMDALISCGSGLTLPIAKFDLEPSQEG